MRIRVLKSKLHRGAVTGAELHYEGSLGLSRELIDAAGLHVHEEILVVNITNGERFTTYVIEEEEPGRIVFNGAAARLGTPGDRVIIMSFGELEAGSDEHRSHEPEIVLLNADNEITGRK